MERWKFLWEFKLQAVLDGVRTAIKSGFAVVVPAGAKHNIINTGSAPLKLYTLYSPPNHRDGVVHHIADALAARGVPFVFATGYDKDRMLEGYRNCPVLQKPFHRAELTDTLVKLLTPRELIVVSVTGTVTKTSP